MAWMSGNIEMQTGTKGAFWPVWVAAWQANPSL
jgi:hypothetical protein